MLRKFGLGVTAAAVAAAGAALATVSPANAQIAYTTNFTTSITYQNVGAGPATISLQFYPENSGTAIRFNVPVLAQGAGTSIFLGNVSGVSAGFTGSAVMSADQPVVATMVQVPPAGNAVRNRPIANGFSSGSSKVLIATVLKNKFNSSTKFSVQNVDTEAVNVTVDFYDADNAGAKVHTATVSALPVGAAKYFAADVIAELPVGFNGSAVITAKKTGDQPANVVAAAMELSTTSTGASSFEGVPTGGNSFYMASALCNTFSQNSAYAVQNTGEEGAGPAAVTVTYNTGKTETKTVAVGAKASFLGCGDSGTLNAPFSGSATITSTGNKIVAIGKVVGNGASTAFLGAASGSAKQVLPYVRWTDSRYDTASGFRQRTYIAIQNVSDTAVSGVTVKYYGKDGALLGSHALGPISAKGKLNSTAKDAGQTEFGYYTDGSFGGSAVVEGPAGSQLVVVARVQSKGDGTQQLAEDYNGIGVE